MKSIHPENVINHHWERIGFIWNMRYNGDRRCEIRWRLRKIREIREYGIRQVY